MIGVHLRSSARMKAANSAGESGVASMPRDFRFSITSGAFRAAVISRLMRSIPAELAYKSWNMELVIERHGDELRIRPAPRRMGDVLGKLAKFSPDFMAQGRGENIEGEREAL